jgi:hypothetical protein
MTLTGFVSDFVAVSPDGLVARIETYWCPLPPVDMWVRYERGESRCTIRGAGFEVASRGSDPGSVFISALQTLVGV